MFKVTRRFIILRAFNKWTWAYYVLGTRVVSGIEE